VLANIWVSLVVKFPLVTVLTSTNPDALTSHASYWADPNFGAFLLAGMCLTDMKLAMRSSKLTLLVRSSSEIFARRLDMLRTGMGLANLNGFENGMGSITENDIPL
jgi:hypothetical protein